MDSGIDEGVAHVRARLSADDEGSLWVLAFDKTATTPLFAVAFTAFADRVDAELLRGLAVVVNGIGARSLLLAIPRASGRPLPTDLRLWLDLRTLVDPTVQLVDLVIVSNRSHWSARTASSGGG